MRSRTSTTAAHAAAPRMVILASSTMTVMTLTKRARASASSAAPPSGATALSSVRRTAEVAGDHVEGQLQVGADQGHGHDDCNCDQCRDQTVLDGGDAAIRFERQ